MSLPNSAKIVDDFLVERGYEGRVRELPTSTRTSAAAAESLGCSVAQIAKSLVFRAPATDRAVLVIASGANRVDEARLAEALGEPVVKADAGFVRERTGFVIGGVPPIAHRQPCPVFIDPDLFALGDLWAAAGTPNTVFLTSAEALCELTGGRVVELKVS